MKRTRSNSDPDPEIIKSKDHPPIEDLIVSIGKYTIDRFLKLGKDFSNSIALYMFYCYTARWQGTSRTHATKKYVSKGMCWSQNKVLRIKRILRDMGLIEDVVYKNKAYIQVKFLYFPSCQQGVPKNDPIPKNGTHPIPKNGIAPHTKKRYPNALSTGSKNALSTNIEQIAPAKSNDNQPQEKILPDVYAQFTMDFLTAQKSSHGRSVKVNPSRIQGGADAIDKLVRIDGFDFDTEVKPACDWAMNHDWWSTRLFSLARLRSVSLNDSTKFVNIFEQYKQSLKSSNNGYDPASASRMIRSISAVFNRQGIGSSNLHDGLPSNQRVEDLLNEMVAYHKAIRYPRGPGSTAARDKIQRSIGTCPKLIDKYCTWIEHDAQWIKQPGTLAFGVTKVFTQFMDSIREEFYGEDILPKGW